MSEPDLFSAFEARDAGIARVLDNTGEWKDEAFLAMVGIERGFTGTGDQFRARIESRVGAPHHYNAWGALIMRALRSNLIVATGDIAPSVRKTSHAHRTPIYRRL